MDGQNTEKIYFLNKYPKSNKDFNTGLHDDSTQNYKRGGGQNTNEIVKSISAEACDSNPDAKRVAGKEVWN